MSSALTTVDENYGLTHANGQEEPVLLNQELPLRQGLHLPLFSPQGFQPQLQWQSAPNVDWEHWTVTAKVTVVPSELNLKNPAIKTATPAESSSTALFKVSCPAYSGQTAPQSDTNAETAKTYDIQINNRAMGSLPSRTAAESVASQIRQAIPALESSPQALQPRLDEDTAAAHINGQTVFELKKALLPPEATADMAFTVTEWVNSLRHMFGAPPLALGEVQMVAQGLGESEHTIGGTASWYGPYFHGRLTATGEIFDQHELTAAHKTLPFGTMLKVRNLLNNKTVVVRINDRGPYIGNRSLDLSYAAAQCLDSEIVGVIPYEATILEPGLPEDWQLED